MMAEDDLERSLGLPATIAISMGSMIGSGIFVLPGVAFKQANESNIVVLAFLLGGILTVPAALSAAELAAAIPESGGSYTYIERGMGPVVGTIAGVGNWMVLNFKTALALIGGLPYLVFLFPWIADFGLSLGPVQFSAVVVLSVVLTVLFTVINVASSDGAGQAQNIIVVVMMGVLGLFILVSLPDVANSDPTSISENAELGGFFTATSVVFVAYAGVIKVTSVAEEIKEPDRNIPLGIIISLTVTTFIYVAITYIAVDVVDISALIDGDTPISAGGLDDEGEGAIVAIAAKNSSVRRGPGWSSVRRFSRWPRQRTPGFSLRRGTRSRWPGTDSRTRSLAWSTHRPAPRLSRCSPPAVRWCSWSCFSPSTRLPSSGRRSR
jgi:Amino acid transporters